MNASELKENGGEIESMALKDRIKEAMGSMAQVDFARQLKRTESAVTQWLNGDTKSIKSDTAARIEAVTGYSAVWVATGRGPKKPHEHGSNLSSHVPGLKVPLISFVQAGSLKDVSDMYEPGFAEEWIEVDGSPSESTFALRVKGDSMQSPVGAGDSFLDGTIIVVDPAIEATHGDYVVAKDTATDQATFKKLMHDGGRWYLKPLNPAYPTIEIDDPAIRVVGKVVEAIYRKKL